MNRADIIAGLRAVVEADDVWSALVDRDDRHETVELQEWEDAHAALNLADVRLFRADMRSRAVLARELLTLLENDG